MKPARKSDSRERPQRRRGTAAAGATRERPGKDSHGAPAARTPRGELRRRWFGVGILVAAAIVTVVAAAEWRATLQRLPAAQLEAVDSGRVNAAVQAARSRASEPALSGLELCQVAGLITAAIQNPAMIEEGQTRDAVAQIVARVSRSRLGRLQQATIMMIELRARGVAATDWWPTLEPYFAGLDDADFSHFQEAFIAQLESAYQSAGLEAGTAREMAENYFEQPHGPFLEFFVRSTLMLASALEHNGADAPAERLRALVFRLLKQWILTPDSPFLRLLSAELLADALNARAATASAPASEPVVTPLAADLHAWRQAYRSGAAGRPSGIFQLRRQPAFAPTQQRRLLSGLALTSWLAAALLPVALFSVFGGWTWLRKPAGAGRVARSALAGLLVAAAAIVTGWVWIHFFPEAVAADFRRSAAGDGRFWFAPVQALLLSAGPVLAVATAMRRWAAGADRLRRLAMACATAWLLLGVFMWVTALRAEAARADLEDATAAAMRGGFSAIAGAQADDLLNRLRAWDP